MTTPESMPTDLDTSKKISFKIKEIKFEKEALKYIDAEPDTAKSKNPVFFAPGWGENHRTLSNSLEAMFGRGRRVVSLEHLSTETLGVKKPEETIDLEKAEVRKAAEIETVMENLDNFFKVDLIAHSEGAINATIFTILNSDRVRSIFLLNPAGLIGKDTFLELACRYAKNIGFGFKEALLNKKSRPTLTRAAIEAIKYIGKNTSRSIDDAMSISQSEIIEILKEIKSRGIKIYIIHSVEDKVFPMDRIQTELAKEKDIVDGFYSVRGNHEDIYTKPEIYINTVDNVLNKLDKQDRDTRGKK